MASGQALASVLRERSAWPPAAHSLSSGGGWFERLAAAFDRTVVLARPRAAPSQVKLVWSSPFPFPPFGHSHALDVD